MATITWASNSPAAWDTGAAWTGGTKPGAGDDAVFTGEYTGNVTAPTLAETVANVYVQSGYTGQMGTSGSPLLVNCGTLDYGGSGSEAHWEGTCDNAIARHSGLGDNALVLDLTGSLSDTVSCSSGKTTIHGSATIANLLVGSAKTEPIVTIQSGATSSEWLGVQSGTVTYEGGAPSNGALVAGGRVTFKDAHPNTLVMAGGRVECTGTTALTPADIILLGGVYDISRLKAAHTQTALMAVFPRAFANLDNPQATFSGTGRLIVFAGGEVKLFANLITPIRV